MSVAETCIRENQRLPCHWLVGGSRLGSTRSSICRDVSQDHILETAPLWLGAHIPLAYGSCSAVTRHQHIGKMAPSKICGLPKRRTHSAETDLLAEGSPLPLAEFLWCAQQYTPLHPASRPSAIVQRTVAPTYIDSVSVTPVAVVHGRCCRIARGRHTLRPSHTANTAAVLSPLHRALTSWAYSRKSPDESEAPASAQAIASPPSGLSDRSPLEPLASWSHPTSLVSVLPAPAA